MNRAFTLLELLVVISIISILLSLTLPAVSRARNKIYSSVCTANLKSIGRAANMYGNDYNSFSMPASFGDTSEGGLNHFINYLFRYVLTHFFIINTGIVLGGNNNGFYTNGLIIFITNRYLGLAVWA